MNEDKIISCDFCGKRKHEVESIVKGSTDEESKDAFICNECVIIAYNYILEKQQKDWESTLSPVHIKEYLDEYVVGQDDVKMVLSVAVYNHYKRLAFSTVNDVELDKSNILMLGPSGSGKTLLVRTLARFLDVPLTMVDATALTEAGYVGEDVENVIVSLYQASSCDIEKTQRGIVYIDEIDKKGRKSDNASITRDVSGEGVQQALLKIVEGTVCRIPPEGGRKHPNAKFVEIDTRNILFIAGGAFAGIEDIIQNRSKKDTVKIGFHAQFTKDNIEYLNLVEPQDIRKFGIIPELVGRFPVITSLKELTLDDIKHIIMKPKNAVFKQFEILMRMEGLSFEVTDDALDLIAQYCLDRGTGARGIRSIFENILLQTQFSIHQLVDSGVMKIVINREAVENNQPMYIYGDQEGMCATQN